MRVQTEEWQRFIPGVRMYKGKKTLFYNGEKLCKSGFYRCYKKEERQTWEVIIVLPGVEVIPEWTFWSCSNVETVIMADTVRRIESSAFSNCEKVAFVKLSTSLEYIGTFAFSTCATLTSIFIPPSCQEVDNVAFKDCSELMIFIVPLHTRFRRCVIANTALIKASPFEIDNEGSYANTHEVNQWIKTINWNDNGNRRMGMNEEYSLHRACSSFNPMEEIIYGIVQREMGLGVFQRKNSIGITPSQYLKANPYADIDERQIMKRFVLDMIGENLL
ncbi:leucine-rich repeat domain-containing protein [Chaetoceros tenuissimus]|uniref:Leucine-rich repeat domain-containing protein n=1 Tax=Chaetoceros tenuissimus TaxID=426638 RepID=A0AAD3CEI2_9STRA|nr:leucine-rich repeat domain-containing protein [Chaetoceros tenuissimus]